jgi:hypothetical protein
MNKVLEPSRNIKVVLVYNFRTTLKVFWAAQFKKKAAQKKVFVLQVSRE